MKVPGIVAGMVALLGGAVAMASAQCATASATCATAINPTRRDSAARAFTGGMMDLTATGVDRFAAMHPLWDGRGVLIAILDSGIDPGIPGLDLTTDGAAKIIDLRDFSGEGKVTLTRAIRRGDTVIVSGRMVLGAATATLRSADGALWGGMITEGALGHGAAADINGNGRSTDSLLLVVAHTPTGWALFVDSRGSGALDAAPVHDFAIAREMFGWHGRAKDGTLLPASVNFAANISDSAGTPVLDIFFDTSSHGSHVTGIASGHNMYGVAGFDGVAPGAQVIGLKIADDAHGAVSTTGSMVRALDYAIRFAHDRGMPLVVNLSFGVGNEIEGTARIDALVDSILGAHPDVVMLVAAGNDGPGLSTLGFPGSASRVIAVGSTLPLVFMGAPIGFHGVDPVASFSSRGGETTGPDIITPGSAYSTVPNYATGDEQEQGTSMSAPHASGLAARLVSGLLAEHRVVPAYMIAAALRSSAHHIANAGTVDQGAGQADLVAAWDWLAAAHASADVAVDVGAVHGRGGVLLTTGSGALGARVTLRVRSTAPVSSVLLKVDAPWIQVPETVALQNGTGTFTVQVPSSATAHPGALEGSITVTMPGDAASVLAIVPVTVRTPMVMSAATTTVAVPAGGVGRLFIAADTGRGLQVQVATVLPRDHATAALHEPGGMPFRDGATAAAGAGDGAALFDVAANDVVGGLYEIDVAAGPADDLTGKITARLAPLRLGVTRIRDSLVATAQNVGGTQLNVRLRAGLIGGSRTIHVAGTGSGPVRLVMAVPAWASHMNADSRISRSEWSRFTDLGVSFLDRANTIIDASPIDYAFSRAALDLPESVRGDSMVVLFTPGFADVTAQGAWSLDLDVHFYVDKPYSLDGGGSPVKPVAAGGTRRESFVQSALPIALSPELLPLVTIVALEGDDHIWTREIAVSRPNGNAP